MLAALKANWLNVAVVLAIIGTVSGWVRAAHYEGVAEAEAASNARLTEQRDSARSAATAARERSDSVSTATERQRHADSVTIARLNASLKDLSAAHDSLERAAEAELQAHDDWLSRETHEAVTANLERSLLVTDSLRQVAEDGRAQERERGDALEVTVGTLTADIGALEAVVEGKDRQIQALESAQGSGFWPDFGVFTKPLYIAIGAAAGYVIAEVR